MPRQARLDAPGTLHHAIIRVFPFCFLEYLKFIMAYGNQFVTDKSNTLSWVFFRPFLRML